MYNKDHICLKCKNMHHEYEAGNNMFWCKLGIAEINPYEDTKGAECEQFKEVESD